MEKLFVKALVIVVHSALELLMERWMKKKGETDGYKWLP